MSEEQQEQWRKAFDHPPKKKKQSPANALTDAIRDYCDLLGCATARINVMGIYDENLGKYRKSGSTPGVEDIDVTLPVNVSGMKVGIKVAVEVKIGRDAQSDKQIKREEKIKKAGGHYIIAKTFDQFKTDFDNIIYHYAKT
jgi:hypothetical protein